MRSRALAVLGMGALGLSAPSPGGTTGPAAPPVTVVPSAMQVEFVGGDALVELVAWSDGGHVDGMAPSATLCLRSERYERWSERRGDVAAEVRSVTTTHGCGPAGSYAFDQVEWSAEVVAEIPTEVETVTSELRDGTWVEVARTRAAGPAASVRGDWRGTGSSTTRAGLVPTICYSYPPGPCTWWRPGVTASRAADVSGSVTFRSTSQVPIPVSAVGTMGWHAP